MAGSASTWLLCRLSRSTGEVAEGGEWERASEQTREGEHDCRQLTRRDVRARVPLKVGVFRHRALAVTVARRAAFVVRRLDGGNHGHRLWLRLRIGMTVAMGPCGELGEYGTCGAGSMVHGY